MGKIISIIIATYNAEKVLKRCLDSIVTQKTNDVEILIVDGNSTDSTMEIVQSYGTDVDYSLSEKDKGIYDAWNKALKVAQGDWIMFLGSDDYILPGSIKIYLDYVRHVDRNETDIICAKCNFINKDGKVIAVLGKPYKYEDFKKYMNVIHGTTLHNSNLFKELGTFSLKYKICADYEFLLRRPLRAEFIDSPLVCVQTGGVSYSVGMLIDTFKIKRQVKCSPLVADVFYFTKGVVSLQIKKLIQRLILTS